METAVRPAESADASEIARIYNHYIAHTAITFETELVDAAEIQRRLDRTSRAALPWLVAESAHGIEGYAYASSWKDRHAYRFSAETTVYVDSVHTGRGIGTLLYDALLTNIRGRTIHSLIGGIALPNEASVRLHERFGFRNVAHFKEVGFKQDRWIDVGYWQLLL
jgi:L-amino acid N-acyltransferase YncA